MRDPDFERLCRRIEIGQARPVEMTEIVGTVVGEIAALPETVVEGPAGPLLEKASRLLVAFSLSTVDRAFLERILSPEAKG